MGKPQHVPPQPTRSHTLSLAVFGHYDSRGGTVAIVLPDISATSAALAFAAYAELFRVAPDQQDEQLLAVAREDFLFLAQLHGGGAAEWPDGNDLEQHGDLAILIDESTGPDPLDVADLEERLRSTLRDPVQLEAVTIPYDQLARYWGEELDHDVEFWQQHAQVLKRPTHRRWDDDAFGFVLYHLPARLAASPHQTRNTLIPGPRP